MKKLLFCFAFIPLTTLCMQKIEQSAHKEIFAQIINAKLKHIVEYDKKINTYIMQEYTINEDGLGTLTDLAPSTYTQKEARNKLNAYKKAYLAQQAPAQEQKD